MSQNYRNPRESWSSDQAAGYARGGRYRSGNDRDRYPAGEEQRFSPDRDRYGRAGFQGDRSYPGSGYQEETGYRGDRGRSASSDEWRTDQPRRYRGADDSQARSRPYENERAWSPQPSGSFPESSQPADYSSSDVYGGLYREAEASFQGGAERDASNVEPHGYFGTGNYAGVDEFAPMTRYRGGHFYAGAGDRPTSENFERPLRGAQSSFGPAQGPNVSDTYGPRGYGPQSRSMNDSYRSGGPYAQGVPSENYRYQPSAAYPTVDRGLSSPDYSSAMYDSDRLSYSHRGRGPKGYERSDERLREIICERLTDDPYIDASDVSVDVSAKKVKLSGVVDSRRTKYEIEELVERCANVRDIDNQLRVRNQNPVATSQAGTSSESLTGGESQVGSSSAASTRTQEPRSSSGASTALGSAATTGTVSGSSQGRKN